MLNSSEAILRIDQETATINALRSKVAFLFDKGNHKEATALQLTVDEREEDWEREIEILWCMNPPH